MAIAILALAALAAAAAIDPGDPSSRPAGAINALPSITIRVYAAPKLPAKMIARTLDEAAVIWRDAGVTIDWKVAPSEPAPYLLGTETGWYKPSTLRVVIDDAAGSGTRADYGEFPVGWITFDDEHSPQQEIHVSHKNAEVLMHAPGIVEDNFHITPYQEEILLSRAMGRALAHEIGHYLLASKAHTEHGLMQARRVANEFFTVARSHFQLDPAERGAVAMRLRATRTIVASR